MKLIVGLGNPGKEYTQTRHNFGFLVVEELAKEYQLRFQNSSFTQGLMAYGKIEKEEALLLLPSTYMNRSGQAVKAAIKSKKVDISDLLVICDDLDLPLGALRIRPQGSSAGHNGLASVKEALGTNEFARLRLGIGKPLKKELTVDYVLKAFSKQEKQRLPLIIEEAVLCSLVWVNEGIDKAMNQFNKRKKDEYE